MFGRSRLFCVAGISIDGIRKRIYTVLLLKWYSSQSQYHASAHHHRCLQSFAIPSPLQTDCPFNKGEDNSMYLNITELIPSDQKAQLTTETQEAIAPSKPVTGIDDHLTDYDKLCGVFSSEAERQSCCGSSLVSDRGVPETRNN